MNRIWLPPLIPDLSERDEEKDSQQLQHELKIFFEKEAHVNRTIVLGEEEGRKRYIRQEKMEGFLFSMCHVIKYLLDNVKLNEALEFAKKGEQITDPKYIQRVERPSDGYTRHKNAVRGVLCMFISDCYRRRRKWNTVVTYLLQAIQFIESSGICPENRGRSHNNLAVAMWHLNQKAPSRFHLRTGIKLMKEVVKKRKEEIGEEGEDEDEDEDEEDGEGSVAGTIVLTSSMGDAYDEEEEEDSFTEYHAHTVLAVLTYNRACEYEHTKNDVGLVKTLELAVKHTKTEDCDPIVADEIQDAHQYYEAKLQRKLEVEAQGREKSVKKKLLAQARNDVASGNANLESTPIMDILAEDYGPPSRTRIRSQEERRSHVRPKRRVNNSSVRSSALQSLGSPASVSRSDSPLAIESNNSSEDALGLHMAENENEKSKVNSQEGKEEVEAGRRQREIRSVRIEIAQLMDRQGEFSEVEDGKRLHERIRDITSAGTTDFGESLWGPSGLGRPAATGSFSEYSITGYKPVASKARQAKTTDWKKVFGPSHPLWLPPPRKLYKGPEPSSNIRAFMKLTQQPAPPLTARAGDGTYRRRTMTGGGAGRNGGWQTARSNRGKTARGSPRKASPSKNHGLPPVTPRGYQGRMPPKTAPAPSSVRRVR